MRKISIDNMELPEFDIIRAKPIKIELTDDKYLLFEIPSVNKYFTFESEYMGILASYFDLFSKIRLLSYKEFADKKLIEKISIQLLIIMQNSHFVKDLMKIIKKYFKANFNIKKLIDIVNPIQLTYLFLLIHKSIETVKKKALEFLEEIGVEISETFSTSLKKNSEKIEKRF